MLLTDLRSSGAQEDDQRLGALPLKTIEHILALLPAAVGNTPRDRVPSQAGKPDSALTGADVRMAAASTVAHLSRSLTNRCPPLRTTPASTDSAQGLLVASTTPDRTQAKDRPS